MASSLPDPMNVRIGLSLGADFNPAHVPLEVCAETRDEPYAKRTLLRWTVTGDRNTRHHTVSKDTYSH